MVVGGAFDLQPRPVAEADPTQDDFRKQVAAFLNTQGIAQPDIQIERALRVDLDGDGSEEVLLNATRLDTPEGSISPNAAAGDYSVVLLLREGQATPVDIDSNVFPTAKDFVAPQRFRLPRTPGNPRINANRTE